MLDKKYNDWQVYHLIQPKFFNHAHFYERRVKALKNSNLNASLLSIIDRKTYYKNKEKYDKATQIEIVKSKSSYFKDIYLSTFILKKLLQGNKIVMHILRVDAKLLLVLSRLPLIKDRLKVIYEFEGDHFSEIDYVLKYSSNSLRTNIKLKLQVKKAHALLTDYIKIILSDALILMSKEHESLIAARINSNFKSFLFPSLPEEKRIHYDESARDEVRHSLNIQDKKVLVYVGNVVCSWQRLEKMCELISCLASKDESICALFLVPPSDTNLVKDAVKRFQIEDLCIIKSVAADEVYKYLSASDVAMYLRHNHTMNKIVTSGKLGEYISTGLPVISTGANASILNNYMKKTGLMIEIDEDTSEFNNLDKYIFDQSKLETARKNLSQSFYSYFSMDKILYELYPNFIKEVIDGPVR